MNEIRSDIIVESSCGCVTSFTLASEFVDGEYLTCKFHSTRPRLHADVIRRAQSRCDIIVECGEIDLEKLLPLR